MASRAMRTSPGSSSTSSTSRVRGASNNDSLDTWSPILAAGSRGITVSCRLTLRAMNRESEAEGSTLRAFLTCLQPDPAAVELHDLAAQRQPDSGAPVLIAQVQPLEDHEDPLGVLRLDADPVVADPEQPLVAGTFAPDLDLGPVLA